MQVSDRQAMQACIDLADEFRVLVEPACGASYAALTSTNSIIAEAETIVIVLCGGSGMDSDMLLQWKQELQRA